MYTKEVFEAQIKQRKKWFLPLSAWCTALAILFLALSFVLLKSLIVLVIVCCGAVFGLFFIFQKKLEEWELNWSYRIQLLLPPLITLAVSNHLLLIIMQSTTIEIVQSLLCFMDWFVAAVILGYYLFFYFNKDGAERRRKWKEWVYKAGGATSETDNWEVRVCQDEETEAPVTMKYEDRFLHTLVLGPTGCGKTSQILIPLIDQDIRNFEAGITVLEPKGDLAIKVAMMAKAAGRPYMYFDPSMSDCPFFNPMIGVEVDVVENMATTFKMLNPNSPQYFLDLNEVAMRNATKVLKRLDKSENIDGLYSTLINLSRLLQNSGGQGRDMVQKFTRIPSPTPEEAKENADIASYFLNEYFNEKSKIYENTSGVRTQVMKITSNEYLRSILNPDIEKGQKNEIDFDKHLEDGGVICISTAQGELRDLSKFLGYFIILQLQSSVFRRPGTPDTRRAHFLYIDEFQVYSNPGFTDMLTMGRSYRVASHLATQARTQMAMGAGRDGKSFLDVVSTNARNIVLFPGLNGDDAKYYSDQFGEYEKSEVQTRISRKKFDLFTGGFDRLGHPTEMIGETKKLMPLFSVHDIIYQPKGKIIFRMIDDNSIQLPRLGLVKYIDPAYNDHLDTEIEKHMQIHKRQKTSVVAHEATVPVMEEILMQVADFEPEDLGGESGIPKPISAGVLDERLDLDIPAPFNLDLSEFEGVETIEEALEGMQ